MKVLDLDDASPTIYLTGWGAVPGPLGYDNAEVCEILGLPGEVALDVERKIGTRFRHACVDLREKRQILSGAALGFAAAALALARAGLPAEAIEAIHAVSTLPDQFCPPYSVAIQKHLGLPRGLVCDGIGGCGAFAQALFHAVHLLRAGTVATILLVASEVLTRHLWSVRRAWEALAFGDGAAAMILSTRHRGPFALRRCALDTVADLDGCSDEIMVIPAFGEVMPVLSLRDARFDSRLPASRFPDEYRIGHRADLAARWGPHCMAESVQAVSGGIDRSSLYVCPHQPSRVVLEAVREELRLPEAQVANINPDFGNLSSASSPMAFCRRFSDGPARHRWTVLAPVGTGLTCGAALLERMEAVS